MQVVPLVLGERLPGVADAPRLLLPGRGEAPRPTSSLVRRVNALKPSRGAHIAIVQTEGGMTTGAVVWLYDYYQAISVM